MDYNIGSYKKKDFLGSMTTNNSFACQTCTNKTPVLPKLLLCTS